MRDFRSWSWAPRSIRGRKCRGRNRLTQTDPDSGAIVTNTYDAANRLLTSEDASGVTTFTYDATGNQLTIEEPSGDVTTNAWDGENRLVQVEHPDGGVVTYAYNGDGLRVEKDDGADFTRFVYDGNNLLQEVDESGVALAEFTCVPLPYARLVSQQRDAQSSFYHFDGIHNTAALTDGGETVTDEYSLDAWGELRSSTGTTPNAHVYKGQLLAYYRDPDAGPESSIYALHHRNYSAARGLFTSQDPIANDLNLYRYVNNNPVNQVDPSGLDVRFEKPNRFGSGGVYLDDLLVGFESYKDFTVSRHIGDADVGRNYVVDAGTLGTFIRFVNQVADQAELESWTPEDWDNWFRKHDKRINPAASDYLQEVTATTPRANAIATSAEPSVTSSGRLYDEIYQVGQTGRPTGDLSRPSELAPGHEVVSHDPEITAYESAALFGPLVVLLAREIAVGLAIEFGGGAAVSVIARGGGLLVRSGRRSVFYSKTRLMRRARRVGHNADDIDVDRLARELDDYVHAPGAASRWAKVSADALGGQARRAYSGAYPKVSREAQRIAARTGENVFEVHHRIPLKYRHLFDADPNRLSNLVGLHKTVHAEISGLWTSFRHAHANPTRSQILDFAMRIDREYGTFFNTLRTSSSFPSFR